MYIVCMTFQLSDFLPSGGIPEANSVVSRTRGEKATIRRPGKAVNFVCMTGEHLYGLTSGGIPEANGVIIRTRSEHGTVKRPRQTKYSAFMALKCMAQYDARGRR